MEKVRNVLNKIQIKGIFIQILVICLVLCFLLFVFTTVISRPHFNSPVGTYYRIRLQVIIDSIPVNFSEGSFKSQGSNTDPCGEKLTKEPVYIETDKSQILRVHWEGITGGEILKYFGLNYIGGFDDTLGYRFDKAPSISPIKIHGSNISKPNINNKMYIYKGNQQDFFQVEQQDFLFQDLEFILKKSKIRQKHDSLNKNSIFGNIPVFGENSDQLNLNPQFTEGQLNELNNLIGNLVVFIQPGKPTTDQVAERFSKLEPLSSTVCVV
jgi:hypothetical protein